MTLEEAAAILGIMPGSTVAEVEAAYVRKARQTHPDRFSDASPAQLAAASAEFIRVADARLALVQARARVLAERTPLQPARPWPLRVWTALLLPGAVLALSGDALSYPMALAVLPLLVLVVILAVRGGRRIFTATVIAALAFAALTATMASFGGLLALGALQVPVMAILILRTPGRPIVTSQQA